MDRAKAALRRLGVTKEQLEAVPNISSLLKQHKGGLKASIEAMRFSQHPLIQDFLEKYDTIPSRDRNSLSWEAVCVAAEIPPESLLGPVILALRDYSANEVKIIAISHHSEVTRARVKFSQLAGGVSDRNALDTALGFLPTAKGSTFIINPTSKSEKEDEDDESPVDDRENDLEHLFPSLLKTQDGLVPPSARMLEGGS